MTITSIKAKALKISIGMKVTFRLTGEVHTFISIPDTPKTFNISGGCITFVVENGDTFAIPAFNGVKESLISEGYQRDTDMCVFFSDEESYPTENEEKWNELLNEMRA